MFIYNVTVHLEESVHEEWLRWIEEDHIPKMLSTGKFLNARLCRIFGDAGDGYTYAVQYTSPDRGALERYYREDAARLRQETRSRFGDKVAAFRTELQILSEHSS